MVSCHNVLRLTLHLTATAFVIAVLFSTATAQRRLDGRVITTDSIPVHNAIVHLRLQEDTTKYFRTLTDSEGRFTFLLTNVESMGTVKDFALHPNFPNPFSSSTTISFSISHGEPVTLRIHDLLGRQVRTLVSQQLEAGSYRVDWDGRDEATKQLSQGAYVSVLQTKNGIATGRLMLSGERQSGKPKTGLTRIGDVVRLGKSASLQQVSIDVRDTTAALPRFLSRTELSYSFESDTSVTIIVDYGGIEDMGFPSKEVRRLFLDDPYLYVCAGKYGLWRRNIDTLASWEYLGLADTTPNMGYGVLDVDANGRDILVAYYGRNVLNLDSSIAVWRSTNDGAMWVRSDSGIVGSFDPKIDLNRMTEIKRSPHKRDIVIALYDGTAMYRSMDGGISWSLHLGRRGVFGAIADLHWNPYSEGEFWISGSNTISMTTFLRAYLSYGDSVRTGLGIGFHGDVAFDPFNKLHVFLSDGPLWESSDGGLNWIQHSLPAYLGSKQLAASIVESPSQSGIFFGSTWEDPMRVSYLFVFNAEESTFKVLGRIDREAYSLVLDKYSFIYCISRGAIYRMLASEGSRK